MLIVDFLSSFGVDPTIKSFGVSGFPSEDFSFSLGYLR